MLKNDFIGSDKNELYLALLGNIEIHVNGLPLNISYAKLRGLLAVLAMSAGLPLQRDYLAELFWPDMPEGTARQNLRRALFNLKSAMGSSSHLLTSNRDTLTLSLLDSRFDVEEFDYSDPSSLNELLLSNDLKTLEQLEHKAKLYRGEFMQGFSLPTCPDFENWLLIQREILHRQALNLLEQLSNYYEQEGNYSKALQFALRHTELEPWDENMQCQVMHLYDLMGQNSTASKQYENFCYRLKTELKLTPGEELQQLAQHIRKDKITRGINSKGLNDLVCALYRSVDQPDEWLEVTGQIAVAIGAEKFLLATRDQVTLEVRGNFHWSLGTDALDDYLAHYSSVDVLSQSLEYAQRGRFYTNQGLYPDKKFLSSELYNDYCRPYNLRHSMGVAFDVPDSTLYTQFACHRGPDEKQFKEDEVRRWNSLVPHLQQFVYLRQKFQHLEVLARSSEQIVERFSVAAFLCKANGQILYRNNLAEDMLSTSNVFTSQYETLSFKDNKHNIKFSELLNQAHNAANGKGGFTSSDWRIKNTESTLELRVLPFTFRSEGIVDSTQPCALVLITNTQSTSLILPAH